MSAVREVTQQLAIELRSLHKALLQAARAAYEVEHGPVAGAMQLLHLVATIRPSPGCARSPS